MRGWRLLSLLVSVSFIFTLFAALNASASAACYSCGSGGYETNEGPGPSWDCECDQYEKCTNWYTQSTVNLNGQFTDYCMGNTLREYYIDCWSFDTVDYVDKDCDDFDEDIGWEHYCTGSQVRKKLWFKDFSCGNGKCSYVQNTKNDQLVSSDGDDDFCDLKGDYCNGCTEGQSDCDSDSECAAGLHCSQVSGTDYCCPSSTEWDGDCCSWVDMWELKCSGGDVYKYDRCGNNEGKHEECGNDYCESWGANYCKNGHVYHSRTCYNKGCSTGSCTSSSYTDEEKVQDCGDAGCSGSSCCTSNNYYTCDSNDVYYFSSCGLRQGKKEECGDDYCEGWEPNYCSNNDVWHLRICHDKGCSGNSCFDETSADEEKVQECGDSYCEGWGSPYCKNGDVYHSRTCYDKGCSGGGCLNDQRTEEELVQDCSGAGCTGGQCDIACTQDSDCGQDGIVGQPYCSNDDVYQDYREYTCNNPGTPQSSCSHVDTPQLQQDCGNDYCDPWGQNYCKNGDVYHNRTCHDLGCSGGSCFDTPSPDEEKVEECGAEGCTDAICNALARLQPYIIYPTFDIIAIKNRLFDFIAAVQCLGGDCGNVDAELRYVTQSSDPVPVGSGTPFYTMDPNPATCQNMKEGDECNTTWRVNATGNLSESYELFAYYQSNDSGIQDNETEKRLVTIGEAGWMLYDDFSSWSPDKWEQWYCPDLDVTEVCEVVNGSLTSISTLSSPTTGRCCNFRTKNFDWRNVRRVKIVLYFNARSTNGEARGNFFRLAFCNSDTKNDSLPDNTENCSGIFFAKNTNTKNSCPSYGVDYGSVWGVTGGCSDNGTLIMEKKNASDPLSDWNATFNGNVLSTSIPVHSRTGVPWELRLYSYKVADGSKNIEHEYHMYDVYYELIGSELECEQNSDCDDGLYCNGQETCNGTNECQPGTAPDCSQFSLDPIATCFNNPDNIGYTWDYFAGFTSECNETADSCTTGIVELTHTCDKSECNAGCEEDTECLCPDDQCIDDDGDSRMDDYADFPDHGSCSVCICDLEIGQGEPCEPSVTIDDVVNCNVACGQDSDCGQDGLVGQPYCSNDDVYQDYREYTCNNPGTPQSSCSHVDTPQLQQDCGNDYCDPWGSPYCLSGNVYHERVCHDLGCSGGICFDTPAGEGEIVEACMYGCTDGACDPPPGENLLYVEPSYKKASVCNNITIYIKMNATDELYGGEFNIYFNASVLEALEIEEGDFFNHDGAPTSFPAGVIINNTLGRIIFTNTRLTVQDGSSGNRTLANITFHAMNAGLTNLSPTDPIFLDPSLNQVSVSIQNGEVEVIRLRGDVNGDCVVNIFDLATVGLAYGSSPGDPRWNPDADLNGDDIVNIFDLATVGLNYGSTC